MGCQARYSVDWFEEHEQGVHRHAHSGVAVLISDPRRVRHHRGRHRRRCRRQRRAVDGAARESSGASLPPTRRAAVAAHRLGVHRAGATAAAGCAGPPCVRRACCGGVPAGESQPMRNGATRSVDRAHLQPFSTPCRAVKSSRGYAMQ